MNLLMVWLLSPVLLWIEFLTDVGLLPSTALFISLLNLQGWESSCASTLRCRLSVPVTLWLKRSWGYARAALFSGTTRIKSPPPGVHG